MKVILLKVLDAVVILIQTQPKRIKVFGGIKKNITQIRQVSLIIQVLLPIFLNLISFPFFYNNHNPTHLLKLLPL
jgi:hypothetical protein